jgi:hypothetical protein
MNHGVLGAIGAALGMAFAMGWEILWALVLDRAGPLYTKTHRSLLMARAPFEEHHGPQKDD